MSEFIAKRGDAALLPLAGVHARLKERALLPAATAFLQRAAEAGAARQGKTTPLEFFEALVTYRNQELGHGSQREAAFYDSCGALILSAVIEVIELVRPFADLQLGLSRDVPVDVTGETVRRFMVLKGDGLVDYVDGSKEDGATPAGRLWLFKGGARVPLHPLVIYESGESDRVGFLNRVVGRPQGDTVVVRRCEYLDYYSGDRLQSRDAAQELAALFTALLKKQVSVAEVEKLAGGEDSADVVVAPGAGNAVIGDFELLGELGRGGMGVVYKARQHSLHRIVALKVLPPALGGDPVRAARFRREIRALARCDHPNIVKVLSAGEDGDRMWYAMEYVEGSDLAGLFEVLARWGAVSGGMLKEAHLKEAITSATALSRVKKEISSSGATDEVETIQARIQAAIPDVPRILEGRDYYVRLAEVVAEAAEGVQHLHERGVIHRDLKPANIMLTSDGKRAVVMDLGLALLEDASMSLTRSQDKIVGTLRYMSPEQADMQLRDDLVDERSDIYSLGATLYELATLTPIFEARTEILLLEKVQRKEPVHPRKANRCLPEDLATIILKATAKDREQRYPRAAAGSRDARALSLADDLTAFARNETIRARPPSALHYLKLFYRRHSSLAHAALVATAALVLATVGVLYKLDQRATEAENAIAERDRSDARLLASREAAALLAEAEILATRARIDYRQFGGPFEAYHAGLIAASEKAREAAKRDPTFSPPWSTAGSCLMDAGEVGAARDSFKKAIALDPVNAAARIGLAELAIHDLAFLLGGFEWDAGIRFQFMQKCTRNLVASASEQLEALRGTPGMADLAPVAEGLRLIATGKRREAAEYFEAGAATSSRPGRWWLYACIAWSSRQTGDKGANCARCAGRALEVMPGDPEALYYRGVASLLAGGHDAKNAEEKIATSAAAERDFSACLKRHPRFLYALANRAWIRYGGATVQGHWLPQMSDQEAEAYRKVTFPVVLADMEAAFRLDPGSVVLKVLDCQIRYLVAVFNSQDNEPLDMSLFHRAISAEESLLAAAPDADFLHGEMGGAHFFAARALLGPKDPRDIGVRRAEALRHLEKSAECLILARKSEESAMRFFWVRTRLLDLKTRKEAGLCDEPALLAGCDEVVRVIDDAFKLNWTDPRGPLYKSRAYMLMGEKAKALAELDAGLKNKDLVGGQEMLQTERDEVGKGGK
ncbi:MAG: protein kinase family [Planctomycetota bacterium]|nr:MAG: protein kinase family [Planctomycetota bacterium]